jgi:preprotein translocase subunit SecF
VEIFREVSIDWLGKKWIFLGISWVLIAVGLVGWFVHGGLTYGIDFTGGTQLTLKFGKTPDLDLIRRSLKPETVGATIIQRFGEAAEDSVLVRTQAVLGTGVDVTKGQREVENLLREAFDKEHVGAKLPDFNNAGLDTLEKYLLGLDPDNWKAQNKTSQEMQAHYAGIAKAMIDHRNTVGGGLIVSLEDLSKVAGVSAADLEAVKKGFFAGPFAIKGVESLGAVVGADLRRRAMLAVGLSFLGMLVYIGFRFKPIYGVGAIIALFHDLAITLGLFALTQKEISLTVIAALLTLVGYSVNDTIVVFDRVRENLRLMRKESLSRILNLSINQTLSRTIMTSGMTFLSVFALFVFGGEVLNGFAFALTVGIIIGTYSSIAIASPIVDWWYRTTDQKTKSRSA